ncbi:hypothetical protein, partial [Rhizobium leguminosarum]|uniref:hypothetical protein n=1 Tax=Rhizobium leguminosarum TaxID=384 RepID=UPI003F97EF88
QKVLCLRATKQLLEPCDLLEPLFQGLQALFGVDQVRLAFYPIALLLRIQKLAQTGREAMRRRISHGT